MSSLLGHTCCWTFHYLQCHGLIILSHMLEFALRRPALESMLEDYWRLMPEYQNVKLDNLQPLRILFGFFPTYRQVALYLPLSANCFTFTRFCALAGFGGVTCCLSSLLTDNYTAWVLCRAL